MVHLSAGGQNNRMFLKAVILFTTISLLLLITRANIEGDQFDSHESLFQDHDVSEKHDSSFQMSQFTSRSAQNLYQFTATKSIKYPPNFNIHDTSMSRLDRIRRKIQYKDVNKRIEFSARDDVSQEIPISDEEQERIESILREFWAATGGTEWIQSLGWNPQDKLNLSDWYGIMIQKDGTISVSLESNNLIGTIPDSFFTIPLSDLVLRANRISGTIPLTSCECTTLATMYFPDNNLTGTIPDCIGNLTNLETLQLTNNALVGTIPPSIFKLQSMFFLVLTSNKLTGELGDHYDKMIFLMELDVSFNQLSGPFPSSLRRNKYIKTIILSNNQFSGLINKSMLSGLPSTVMKFNIAHNQFHGYFGDLAALTSVVSLTVAHNRFYGPMPLFNFMIRLAYADLSYNLMNESLAMRDLYNNFGVGSLSYFDVTGNKDLIRTKSEEATFPFEFIGSTLSKTSEDDWTCKSVTVRGQTYPIRLDPSYLDYEHCACIQGYYGRPPDRCFECPADPNNFCPGGPSISWTAKLYPQLINTTKANGVISTGTDKLQDDSTVFHTSINPEFITTLDTVPASTPVVFEDCIPFGCNGDCELTVGEAPKYEISFQLSANSSGDASSCPCSFGHSGRKCSRCICKPSDGFCFVWKNPVCSKCTSLWNSKSSTALLVSVVTLLFLLFTFLHFMCISSGRSPPKKKDIISEDNKPGLAGRGAARCGHLFNIGYFNIFLIWIQTLSAIAVFPSALVQQLSSILKLSTGNPEAFGISCIWTILNEPMWNYVVNALIPLVFLCLLLVSLTLANLIWHILQRFKRSRRISLEEPERNVNSLHSLRNSYIYNKDDENSTESNSSIQDGEQASSTVIKSIGAALGDTYESDGLTMSSNLDNIDEDEHYSGKSDYVPLTRSIQPVDDDPAQAIARSPSGKFSLISVAGSHVVTILYFFYFSVSLSSLALYTKDVQPGTNAPYIQDMPWIPYYGRTATALRQASIPFLTFITAGTPILFGFLLWYFRRRTHQKFVFDMIGGLYRVYRKPLYWWEMMVIARRLALSLALRIPMSSSFYTWTVVIVLSISLFVQILFQPYVRKLENRIEEASILLLICTFVSQNDVGSGMLVLFWVVVVLNGLFLVAILVILFHSWCTSAVITSFYDDNEDPLWKEDFINH